MAKGLGGLGIVGFPLWMLRHIYIINKTCYWVTDSWQGTVILWEMIQPHQGFF